MGRFRTELRTKFGALARQGAKLLKAEPLLAASEGRSASLSGAGSAAIPGHGRGPPHPRLHPGRLSARPAACERIGLPAQRWRPPGRSLFSAVAEPGPIDQAVVAGAYEGLRDRDRRREAMMADAGRAESGEAAAPLDALDPRATTLRKPTAFPAIGWRRFPPPGPLPSRYRTREVT